jgi:hypothetical protein
MDSDYQSNLDAFNSAKDQLSGLVDQVKGLTGGTQDSVDKLGTVLQTGGNVGSGIMGVLGSIEQITRGTQLEGTISSLKNQLSSLKDNLADGIQKGVESGISKATDAAKSLTGNNAQLNSMIDSASGAARNTTNTAINQAAGGDFAGLMDTAQTAGNTMLTTGSDTVQLVRGAATDAGAAVESGARSLVSNVEQQITGAVSSGSETMTGLANQGIAMATNVGSRASSTLTGAAADVSALARNVPKMARATRTAIQAPETMAAQPTPTTAPSSAASSTTNLATTTTPETPSLDLPSFEGLADFPEVSAPISNLFGLVPRGTLSTIQQAAPEAEATLGRLVSGLGTSARSVADGSAIPSRVLGLVNKGQRGDSSLARALGLTGEKPTAPVSAQETIAPEDTAIPLPTMQDIQRSMFSDPSETLTSRYLPTGDFGDVTARFAGTGIPEDVLAQARLSEPLPAIPSSSFDSTVPQTRITAAEPTAQPVTAAPESITGTPNNPSISAAPSTAAPSTAAPTTAPSTAAPSTAAPTTTPSTTATAGEVPAVSTEISSSSTAVESSAAPLAATEIEGAAIGGPEGLVAGALLAGITSLIGGLIKDFHSSAPKIPIFQTTGASLSPQEQVNAATAF